MDSGFVAPLNGPHLGCAHGGGAPPAAADFHRLLLRMRRRASPAGGHFAPAGGPHPCAEGTPLPHCTSSHNWKTVPRRNGFRLRRSVEMALFSAVCMEAVRRLPRRAFNDCSCACDLRASPAGGHFASAGGIHPCAEGTPLPHCTSSHDWKTVPHRNGGTLLQTRALGASAPLRDCLDLVRETLANKKGLSK